MYFYQNPPWKSHLNNNIIGVALRAKQCTGGLQTSGSARAELQNSAGISHWEIYRNEEVQRGGTSMQHFKEHQRIATRYDKLDVVLLVAFIQHMIYAALKW